MAICDSHNWKILRKLLHPTTGNPVVVDTTASIDLTIGDTIVVTFKPTGQAQVTLTAISEYTVDEALNTVTVLADVLANGVEGVLTVRVTRMKHLLLLLQALLKMKLF